MLRDKDRMAAHRRLAPVIRRVGRGETGGDEITRMREDLRAALAIGMVPFPRAETEPPPERGGREAREWREARFSG